MSPKQTKKTQQTTKDNPKFIEKVSSILSNPEINHIVSWNPEGSAIIILNPDQFEQKVLPSYFKHRQLTSFVRQLNLYGFHKEKGATYEHTYSNQFFLRDQPELMSNIKRKNSHENHIIHNENIMETPIIEFMDNEADRSSLAYENSVLFNLQKQAMERLAMLEETVRNLTQENNALWCEVNKPAEANDEFKGFFDKVAYQYNGNCVNGAERKSSGERCDASTDSNTHGSRVNQVDLAVKKEMSEDLLSKYIKNKLANCSARPQVEAPRVGKMILNEELIKESKRKMAQSKEKFDYFIQRNQGIKPDFEEDIKEDFYGEELVGAKRMYAGLEDELFDDFGNPRKALKWYN